MKKTAFFLICAVIILLSFLTANYGLARAKAGKTARTYIRVLPYANKDPFTIEAPPTDQQMQKNFRMSLAELMKHQSFLMDLISRDKFRNTDWYKNMGKHTEARNSKALKDLEKNFKAVALDDREFIRTYPKT